MLVPKVSIIIPCFNSGKYLSDALGSVKQYKGSIDYEVIVVNDGSTDKETINTLNSLPAEEYTVIHQQNAGASSARNTGSIRARGEYLLLFDSDNKIKPDFITRGVSILDEGAEIGVVYGNVSCFGDGVEERAFSNREFDITLMLAGNMVDMCSLVRKKVWEQLGGLDQTLTALEDWDFFLRVYSAGWKFKYDNCIYFEYRVRKGSLIDEHRESGKLNDLKVVVYNKHVSLLAENYKKLIQNYVEFEKDQTLPFRTFVKMLYRKYFRRPNSI